MAGTFKNLCETHIIDPACRESFLPVHHPGCDALRKAGISLGGVSVLRRRYEIGRVRPPYHVLLLTLQGEGLLTTDSTEHRLGTGNFCLLPAGSAYHYRLASKEWRAAWLHLSKRKRWSPLETEQVTIGPTVHESDLTGAMNLLIREANSSAVSSRRLMELQSELLLLLTERLLGTARGGPAGPYEEALKNLWARVGADLAAEWTVRGMARDLHITPGHLHRLVQEAHGTTPMRMVTSLRLQRAEHLLRFTSMPISRVAEMVGYSDAFAFSTAFKRSRGVSPSSLRKRATADVASAS